MSDPARRWSPASRVFRLVAAASLLAFWGMACHRGEAATGAGSTRVEVVVSVPPQAWLVRRIGGDRVDVHVLLPPGASEHTYEPTPQQVARLGAARLVVEVGHPSFLFERRLLDALLDRQPRPLVVDMTRHADLIQERGAGSGSDPHLWLSPAVMRATAQDVAAVLGALDPAGAATYRQGLVAVLAEITALDGDLRRELASLAGRRFLVYHPAWGYLARDYGLEQVAIEAEGKEPSARRMLDVAEMARREGLGTVFVERWSSDRSARAIAGELGARVVTLDPLAEDWPANLRRVGGALREALGG